MTTNYKGNRIHSSSNTQYNALDFLIKNTMHSMLNTALPVKVVEVIEEMALDGGSKTLYLSLLPLILQYDAYGKVLENQIIYKVPCFSLQSGKAAILMKPEVNDIGIAIFAQQDISQLSNIPKKPASYRSFSFADAIYIGSIQGMGTTEPEIFIKFLQEGEIEIEAKESVRIKSAKVEIVADDILLEGNVRVEGDMILEGSLEVSDTAEIKSDAKILGKLEVESTIDSLDTRAGQLSLKLHTHCGVESGNSNTGVGV